MVPILPTLHNYPTTNCHVTCFNVVLDRPSCKDGRWSSVTSSLNSDLVNVTISWPPHRYPNGTQFSYTLTFSIYGGSHLLDKVVQGSSTSYTFTDLTLGIAAKNICMHFFVPENVHKSILLIYNYYWSLIKNTPK